MLLPHMMESDKERAIRAWFVLACRNPARRTDGRRLGIAHRWEPFTVRHPELPFYFTESGAWDFIADCIEAGEDLRHIPPSDDFPDYAVFMVHMPIYGDRRIYIKVARRPALDRVIGVSFHYSTEDYRS